MRKAFRQDSNTHALCAAPQRFSVAVGLWFVLARIKPVLARQDFKQQCIVQDIVGDRTKVVDGLLNGHGTRVRDQPVGWFHAVDTAVGGRNAD